MPRLSDRIPASRAPRGPHSAWIPASSHHPAPLGKIGLDQCGGIPAACRPVPRCRRPPAWSARRAAERRVDLCVQLGDDGLGVPAGARKRRSCWRRSPSIPARPPVGTSGSELVRLRVETATARTLPAFTLRLDGTDGVDEERGASGQQVRVRGGRTLVGHQQHRCAASHAEHLGRHFLRAARQAGGGNLGLVRMGLHPRHQLRQRPGRKLRVDGKHQRNLVGVGRWARSFFPDPSRGS